MCSLINNNKLLPSGEQKFDRSTRSVAAFTAAVDHADFLFVF